MPFYVHCKYWKFTKIWIYKSVTITATITNHSNNNNKKEKNNDYIWAFCKVFLILDLDLI